jgi:thiol-disulfide isomerase/thioredoxin
MNKFIFSVFVFVSVFGNTEAQSIPNWKLNNLKAAIANAGKPTIFNFRATFCKPCVEEIPYFQQLAKKYDSAGVQLVLISLDLSESYPKNIFIRFKTQFYFSHWVFK